MTRRYSPWRTCETADTCTRLAARSGIGAATARRYVREAVDLATVMNRIREPAYAILDGTLIPMDRVADQKPHYSGKHKRHGVNVQVIADTAGRLIWASAALPGRTHDLNAVRRLGIIQVLTSAEVITFTGKGYQGAGGTIRVPFERHRSRPELQRRQERCNRQHARIRARGERAIATLKTWKLLTKLRCCPRRATAIVQAVLVLHDVEANRYAG